MIDSYDLSHQMCLTGRSVHVHVSQYWLCFILWFMVTILRDMSSVCACVRVCVYVFVYLAKPDVDRNAIKINILQHQTFYNRNIIKCNKHHIRKYIFILSLWLHYIADRPRWSNFKIRPKLALELIVDWRSPVENSILKVQWHHTYRK